MTDVIVVAVIVAFFGLSALLVRALGLVVDEAAVEFEPDPDDSPDRPLPDQPLPDQPLPDQPLPDRPR